MTEVIITHRCPICKKIYNDMAYAPFCSKRCADVDLNRWFNGSYAVASEDYDEADIAELNEEMENAHKSSQ